MPPNPSSSSARPHTLRTIILTAIATVAVLAVVIFILAWNSSSGSIGVTGMMQSNDSVSSEAAVDYGVATKRSAVSMGMVSPASPEMMPSPMPPIYDGGATIEDRQKVGDKIIRTGNLDLRVDDAEKRMTEAKALAKQFGGFVDSSNLIDNGGVKTGYITVRVPSEKYEELISAAKKLAVLVLSENSNSEDVTAQYVDLDARLKTAKAEEAQYLEILKQAKTVEDTLKVTQALSQVRSTIEQLQGQLRYLTDRTDFSTLTISLTEQTKIQAPTKLWKPLETIRQAFQGLIIVLQGFVDFLIGLAIYGIGFILPIILLVWLAYRLVRWLIGKVHRKK
ncbi:DUF4349 domain-containing protein [Candidatus Uhrbacteria bacterium]|nr:DUF4349 domain-containing protein [Candidatus Uhrbacteria bacterium]